MPAPAGATPGDSIETLFVDIAARADRLVADAETAVNHVVKGMQQIDKAAENTGSVYTRLGGTIKQALSIATGIAFYNVTAQVVRGIVNLGKSMIDSNTQMQTFQKTFEVLTGSVEEAGAIIDWVREQAKKTPFDVPGLIEASQMLMTWGLDLKEWFTVVGDVAAGMNRPISQVVNAVGTLASGQTGEAVRRFRDLGINLREYSQLKFDAQGSLITPLEEAIPIVREIMVERFGGMMESQSKTWTGIMSNMRDTWQQFVQVVGEPLFTVLNEQLVRLGKWVEENSDEIEGFAEDLGSALVAAFNTLTGLLDGFTQLIGLIDEVVIKLTGMPDWFPRGVAATRKVVGITMGMQRAELDFIGGLIQGKSVEQAAKDAAQAWRETMLDIGGWSEKTKEEVVADAEEISSAYQAVLDVLPQRLDQSTTFEVAKEWVKRGEAAQIELEVLTAMEAIGMATEGASEKFREQYRAVLEVYRIYLDATAAAERLARAEDEAAAALADQNAAFQKALDLAMEAAPDLTDTLRDAMEAMAEGLESAGAASEQAIAEVAAKAAEAEQAAILSNQQAVAKLRAEFERDQLRRRQEFNRQWERLIREQNDTNADAEWEYQYERQQLLIEGDELALAELEARYEHEKETRDRDQGQAQEDMRQQFENEKAELEARFNDRLQALEGQLQDELAKVKEQAEEAAEEQREKDEETRKEQQQNAEDLYKRLGEMLYDETQGNDEAARLILAAWSEMYSGIETDAVWTAYVMQRELNDTIALILQARAELERLRQEAGTGWIPPSGAPDIPGVPSYDGGGYTPGTKRTINTAPGEFIQSRSTTRALEMALGGRLTQEALQGLALSTTQRRLLDVNVKAQGVPAGVLNRMYRDLITAMTEESGEY